MVKARPVPAYINKESELNIILKGNVNKKTAVSLMTAVNQITPTNKLLRENGHWCFSAKPKKRILTLSVWLELLLHKYIKSITGENQ